MFVVATIVTVWVAAAGATEISPWLYLNRCTGGCQITGGSANDAMAGVTEIQPNGTYTIGEFENGFGQVGSSGTCLICPDSTHLGCSPATAAGSSSPTTCLQDSDCTTAFPGMNAYCETADADWNAVVQCMTEIDSYFALHVVETPPPGGTAFTECAIAGLPTDLDLGPDILGIAPIACTPQDNAIAFAFANYHPGYAEDRVLDICWTAAQKTGLVWGLDFEYSYVDGGSTCSDPMGVDDLCGGEKFYRDRTANVGFGSNLPGSCRLTQNSYQMLLALFGPGSPSIVPTASITYPATGAAVDASFAIDVSAGSKRGVWTLDLLLNGFQWSTQTGVAFGADGQPNPSSYTFVAPSSIPMGTYDVVAQACDDVGICASSPPVTVTYGAACTSDTTCARGQHCNTTSFDNGIAPSGGCYWDAPTGELGQSCTYPQFCKSGICDGTETERICTESCALGVGGVCPEDLECLPNGGSDSISGICFKYPSSGCSTGDANAGWTPGSFVMFAIALALRRRRCA